jgi:hypothetical protein
MPKIYDTRKDKADELLKMLTNGPAAFHSWFLAPTSRPEQDARRRYNIWTRSWIIPAVIALVPELKGTEEGEDITGDCKEFNLHTDWATAWQVAGLICDKLAESGTTTTAKQHEDMAHIIMNYGLTWFNDNTQEFES